MSQQPSLHSWQLTPKEAVALQRELAPMVKILPGRQSFDVVAATDISYSRGSNMFYAAVVVMDLNTMTVVEQVTAQGPVDFPYVSGLLSFREIPLLLCAFAKLKHGFEAVICDGQGIAHPRRIGLASHLGLWLGIPTMGCGKSRLFGRHQEPGPKRGAKTRLVATNNGTNDVIGYVLRTRDGVKPVYVSPGHLCSLDAAVETVLRSTKRYRLPEPIRAAHNLCNEVRRADLTAMNLPPCSMQRSPSTRKP